MLYVFFLVSVDHFLPILLLISQEPRTKEMLQVLRMDMQGPVCQEN
jgi:hypothetical protein